MDKKYGIVLCDPPWKQTKGGLRKTRPHQLRELGYDTLTIEDIFKIQKYVMKEFTTDNHTVFLWTIDKFLHEAEKQMGELGYKLHARIVWDKGNGVAPAFTVRYSHEYLLWFYFGKLAAIATGQRGRYTTILREKSTKHSKKPICSYEMIEKLYPDVLKLEMYARDKRQGWDVWGYEVDSDICLFQAVNP